MVYIWRREISVASALFLVNRYGTLCFNALSMIKIVTWPRDLYDSGMADHVGSTHTSDVCSQLMGFYRR